MFTVSDVPKLISQHQYIAYFIVRNIGMMVAIYPAIDIGLLDVIGEINP